MCTKIYRLAPPLYTEHKRRKKEKIIKKNIAPERNPSQIMVKVFVIIFDLEEVNELTRTLSKKI